MLLAAAGFDLASKGCWRLVDCADPFFYKCDQNLQKRSHLDILTGPFTVPSSDDAPKSNKKVGRAKVSERPDFVRLISYIAWPAACCRFRVLLLHAAAQVVW